MWTQCHHLTTPIHAMNKVAWHWNWANDGFRTVVLNGVVWAAGLDVPAAGVPSKAPTMEQLEANLDESPSAKFDRRQWVERLRSWEKG